MSNCKLEALVSVDRRGQVVLPKEVRDRSNIQAGEKLVVFTREMEEGACCVFLIEAEDFAGIVKSAAW